MRTCATTRAGPSAATRRTRLRHRDHATAVVGVLGGDRNSFGIVGLAPEASVRGSFSSIDGVPAAIRAATDLLGTGDLILIEAHAAGPRFDFKAGPPIMDTTVLPPRVIVELPGYIAMEWWPSVYQATKYAAAHGVIVLAAAGNGAEDLDDDLYDTPGEGFPDWWVNPFRRSAGRDSSAIVVGAGAGPDSPWGGPARSRLPFSNDGSVVDAQGWGVRGRHHRLRRPPGRHRRVPLVHRRLRRHLECPPGRSGCSRLRTGHPECAHLRSTAGCGSRQTPAPHNRHTAD